MSADRIGRPGVSFVMLRSCLMGVLCLGVAACGGGSKKANTTPKSGGSVSYEDQPGGNQGGGGGGANTQPDDPQLPEQGGGGGEPVANEPEQPKPEQKKPEPKPPGEDLSPQEKQARIAQALKAGNDATRKEDADGMIREALTILDVDQVNVEAMVMLAHGYFLKGWDDKAEGVLAEAIKRSPDKAPKNAKLWMLLGLLSDRSTRPNKDDQSLVYYSKAIEQDNRYARAYTNRGIIYLKRKAYVLQSGAGAVSDFIKVDELEMGKNLSDDEVGACACRQADTCANLGAAWRGRSADQGQPRDELLKRAEKCFKNANTVDAGYAPAYFDLGVLYLDADPFPGLDKLKRLEIAKLYFEQYKQRAGALSNKDSQVVDNYIAAAVKAHEVEEKIRKKKAENEEKKRKEAERKAKEAKDKPPANNGGGGQ